MRTSIGSPELVDLLDALHRGVLAEERALPLPRSFLLDDAGRVVVLYRGQVSLAEVTADLPLTEFTPAERRQAATAFPGRWCTRAHGPSPAWFTGVLRGYGRDDLAARIAALEPPRPESFLAREVQAARSLPAPARSAALRSALRKQLDAHPADDSALVALARLLAEGGQVERAVELLIDAMFIEPRHAGDADRLAWILAVSPEPASRRPGAALRLAEAVCLSTKHRAPEYLDTRAAALARRLNRPQLADQIEARARRYADQRPADPKR